MKRKNIAFSLGLLCAAAFSLGCEQGVDDANADQEGLHVAEVPPTDPALAGYAVHVAKNGSGESVVDADQP